MAPRKHGGEQMIRAIQIERVTKCFNENICFFFFLPFDFSHTLVWYNL